MSIVGTGLGAAIVGASPWIYQILLAPRFPQWPQTLPPWVIGVTLALGIVWIVLGLKRWQRLQKDQARLQKQAQDARAIVVAVLSPLERQGWTLNYGTQIPGVGTIEILVTSPQGNRYCLGINGYRGKVGSDGRSILRQYDHSQLPFAMDPLSPLREQAAQLQGRSPGKAPRPVTPILVLPEAILEVGPDPIQGVYVLGKQTLRSGLLKLG